MVRLLIFMIFIITSSLNAVNLTNKQIETLKLVKEVALNFRDNSGETFENTAMSICLTETSAGLYKIGDTHMGRNLINASLGIMQVRVQTARFIAKKLNIKKIKEMSDVELAHKLLNDDRFNVEVAVRYIVWLSNRTKSYFKTISRYNGGNNNKVYVKRVMSRLRYIKKVKDLV